MMALVQKTVIAKMVVPGQTHQDLSKELKLGGRSDKKVAIPYTHKE
jgi:hypothetical protein